MLDLARDVPPDRAELSVAERLNAVATRWQAAASAAGGRTIEVTHRRQAGHDPPIAYASLSAVDHILDILVENAVRHGRGPIRLRAEPRHGVVAIEVSDDGTIGRDMGAELFHRGVSEPGSTGIGLHLARSLAVAEGGRLRLARREPTVFELLLRTTETGSRTGRSLEDRAPDGAVDALGSPVPAADARRPRTPTA